MQTLCYLLWHLLAEARAGCWEKSTLIGSIWPWPFLGQRKTLETPPPHPNLLS